MDFFRLRIPLSFFLIYRYGTESVYIAPAVSGMEQADWNY